MPSITVSPKAHPTSTHLDITAPPPLAALSRGMAKSIVLAATIVSLQLAVLGLCGFLTFDAIRSNDNDAGSTTPPLPGVMGNHIVLGMAPDYPPYTNFSPDGTADPIDLGGFNKEFIDLIEPICGIKVDTVLAPWSDCWTAKPKKVYFDAVTEYIGEGIWEGRVHGCTAYTHTKGERGLSLEFTDAILGGKKRAGILTRLVNGKPVISPRTSDFTNVKIGDVAGWAPTPDTFKYNINSCTGKQFKGANLLTAGEDGNEAAVNALLDGTFDALYLYADQLNNFATTGTDAEKALAAGLGTQFAYIHTGLNDWSYNGTTLAISKRGSGLKEVLNPCIEKVVATQEYTTMCESYWSPSTCIQNEFSTSSGPTSYWYDDLMNARTDSKSCKDGYCTCDELP